MRKSIETPTDSKNPVIQTVGMTRRFGEATAVNQVDLNIQKGMIYGFLGPNGCGKSTSIRMLTGLLLPSQGQISVLGYKLPEEAELLRPKIGYMTQKFSLYDNLSVEENLNFVSQIYGLSKQSAHTRKEELLHLYNLNQYRSRMAGSLSGGQKQRLALAAATLHKPELLFLDEPTSAVDPENRRDFWEHLFDLSNAGTTILVSTHYMDEAERCHALAILEKGVKRADGTPQALMDNMGANVVELSGPHLRELKSKLLLSDDVVSAAQLGTRLRVLIRDHIPKPEKWILNLAPQCEAESVRPSLEDVFVMATGHHHDEPAITEVGHVQ